MSMLRNSVAKTLFAAAAITAGGAAMAATGPFNGPSDLFAAVWNPATGKSWVEDLGSNWSFAQLASTSTFNSSAGFTTSFTLDGGHLTSDLTAGTYSFDLFAGDLTAASPTGHTYQGNTYYLSELSGLGGASLTNTQVFDNAGTNNTGIYVSTNIPDPNQGFLNTNSANYWCGTNQPCSAFGLSGYQGAASGTGAVELWRYFATGDTTGSPTQKTNVGNSSFNGQFTLNDSTGVLTYTLAANGPTTPLPAAGWLLVSGLLGLGAVGRRKAAAATPAV